MNLLGFLTSIVQYRLSWDKPASIQKIKKILEKSGPVWQKFAQSLSGKEELIGADLALELQDMLNCCPTHSDAYSKKAIRRDFGDKYDVSDMELIGSGTIAQVYRIGDICIKIRHPNVDKEVANAVASYNKIRENLFFMPLLLKHACDIFFEGIEEQLDFHREFRNGNTFKQLFHAKTNHKRNLFVIPRMLDKSDECLVMEYEPSQPLVVRGRSNINKHVLLKGLHGILELNMIGTLHGFIHADLHFGNYGIRGEFSDLQIVIYDFGHMYDIRENSYENRRQTILSFVTYDTELFINSMVDDERIQKRLVNSLKSLTKDKDTFSDNLKCILAYSAMHNLSLRKVILQQISFIEKMNSSTDLLSDLESNPKYRYMADCLGSSREHYYDTYFPHDDMRELIRLS
jgi:predicted unusual protein kinase regulating ubiquinone biosynthesis (AarF/ABC1/UbiB family)